MLNIKQYIPVQKMQNETKWNKNTNCNKNAKLKT